MRFSKFRQTAGLSNTLRVITTLVFIIIMSVSSSVWAQNNDSKVIILSIDGMPDYILDKLIAEGRVPNIARLAQNGVRAERMITSFPAETTVAHPVIWTGADPWDNGIPGGGCIPLPFKENTILSRERGMTAQRLMAEPIWSTVARQGKKAFVLQATHCYPQNGIFYGDDARFKTNDQNLTILDGYAKKLQGYKLIDEKDVRLKEAEEWQNLPVSEAPHKWFATVAGEASHHFLFFDSPKNEITGYDSLWICSQKDGKSRITEVVPATPDYKKDHFSDKVLVTYAQNKAYVYYRLFQLAPDLTSFRILRTAGHDILAEKKDIAGTVFHQAGGFIGNGARFLYARELLGKRADNGGDGSAEIIYLETIRKMLELSEKAVTFSLQNYQWDLFHAYIPVPDEVSHNWLGSLNPSGMLPEEGVCKALEQPMNDLYSMIDHLVGKIIENMPQDALLVLVSDHGHAPVTKTLLPNILLKKAGLLSFDEDGNVDLSKTKAMYYLGNSYFIVINSKKYKDGIVELDQVEEIKNQVKAVLLSAKDENGEPVVTGFFEPKDESGAASKFGGDLYIKLKPGVNCRPHYQGDEHLRVLERPISDHYGDPAYRYMNSIFVIGKKYGKVDREYGIVLAKDIAPTICSILGVDIPLQATGKVLHDLEIMMDNKP